MTAYLIRRLLTLVPVLAVVVTVVFLLIHLIPGDPVSVMLGPDATAEQVQATRQALGLDSPLHEQLLKFYSRVLRGDLAALRAIRNTTKGYDEKMQRVRFVNVWVEK